MLVPNPNRFSSTFLSKYIHRAHLGFCCAKPLRPAAYVMPDSTSRGVTVARTRAWHRWKAAPPFGGSASASRFSSTFLSKDIHRKRPAPGCTSVKTPYPNPNPNLCWCATFFSLLFLDPINIYFLEYTYSIWSTACSDVVQTFSFCPGGLLGGEYPNICVFSSVFSKVCTHCKTMRR